MQINVYIWKNVPPKARSMTYENIPKMIIISTYNKITVYEGGTPPPENWNYLLEGGPVVVQASPIR